MKIRSTGLGKTLLTAQIGTVMSTRIVPATLELNDREPKRLLLTMEIVEPVHWTVRAFMEPGDLRRMLKLIMTRPGTLYNALLFLFSKSPKASPEAKAGNQTVVMDLKADLNSKLKQGGRDG